MAGELDMHIRQVIRIVLLNAIGLGLPAVAIAGDDDPKKPNLHELARVSSLPKAHKDFSAYRYRPAGDKVIEQADANRLLFRTRTGQPDGYAERRGDAIVYFDQAGQVTRVQPLGPDAGGN